MYNHINSCEIVLNNLASIKQGVKGCRDGSAKTTETRYKDGTVQARQDV